MPNTFIDLNIYNQCRKCKKYFNPRTVKKCPICKVERLEIKNLEESFKMQEKWLSDNNYQFNLSKFRRQHRKKMESIDKKRKNN